MVVIISDLSDDVDAIITAMREGAFYASTGVTLREVHDGDGRMVIEIAAEPGVTYTTEFIGTRVRDGEPVEIGAVLAEVTGDRVEYEATADVLYVRARVTSSRAHPNPFAQGDMETAWVQPILGPAAGASTTP